MAELAKRKPLRMIVPALVVGLGLGAANASKSVRATGALATASALSADAGTVASGIPVSHPEGKPRSAQDYIARAREMVAAHPGQSAAMTLERGELSLLTRAWLVEHAERSIDVQYFIWNADNVGRLAMDAFLRAADRGVKVRILVDDFLLDAPGSLLGALDGHPNIEIRVYNPVVRTGISFWRRWWNALTRFRGVNQRMHNKAVIVDGFAAVTGGRNLGDEYYDFHHDFDFRDRDLLLLGGVIGDIGRAFGAYWNSGLSRRYGELVAPLSATARDSVQRTILAYAADTSHFAPAIRSALQNLHTGFDSVFTQWVWAPMRFITDVPGKNPGTTGWLGLRGGGATTRFLAGLLDSARRSITLQTPYLVPDEAALGLLRRKIAHGVPVRIVTNSLATNDNVQAMAGYLSRREAILAAGVGVFEYKPHPAEAASLIDRLPQFRSRPPIFVLHAKTAVIDHARVFIGTFNFDPRSMNLNTESGVLIEDPGLAREVEASIERSMRPENSWEAARETGDHAVSWWTRLKTRLWSFLPIRSLV